MNLGGKISTCFLKLHSTCPKENFELKTLFLKVLFFFKLFRTLNEHLLCLARKFSERDIKIEKCSFRLIRSIKKSNFWKFSFFSNSSELRTNNNRARRKSFRQGYQNWKLQFSSQWSIKNSNFWKIFFIKFFKTLNEHLPCLAKNFSAGLSKLKIAVFVSKDQ